MVPNNACTSKAESENDIVFYYAQIQKLAYYVTQMSKSDISFITVDI